jgi:hypothetical protein
MMSTNHRNLTSAQRLPGRTERVLPLFNFQWLARSDAWSIFLLSAYSSRRRLFINQPFFEQLSTGLRRLSMRGVPDNRLAVLGQPAIVMRISRSERTKNN